MPGNGTILAIEWKVWKICCSLQPVRTVSMDPPTRQVHLDGSSVEKASMQGMDATKMLSSHDSYSFFNSIEIYIR